MDIMFVLRRAMKFLDTNNALNLRLVCKGCTFDRRAYGDEFINVRFLTTKFGVKQMEDFPCTCTANIETQEDLDVLNGLDEEALTSPFHVKVKPGFVIKGCPSFYMMHELDLTGTIVQDLSALKNSEISLLVLESAKVSDISFLEGCNELTSLNLNFTDVTDITILGTLTSLTSLFLKKSKCRDFTALSLLNLEELNLEDAKHFRHNSLLKEMSSLAFLNLSGTGITNITGLSKLSELRELNLAITRVSNISPIKNLRKLEKLTMSCMRFVIEDISYAQHVEYLDLSGTCNNYLITQIAEFKKLRILTIIESTVTDVSPLVNCENLRFLCTNGTADTSMLSKCTVINADNI
ncbi:MAG TPA: hypothetical protein VLE02_01155 [Nitrosarchaeum sp.]|nr:hypothetical protein [Nitrosarchaeum sp.]